MKLQIHTPLCALCALLVFVSCLNDDRSTKTSLDIPDEWVTYVSEDVFPIDENYKPSQHEIAKTWVGEYYGYDVEQEKNTKITRTLVLLPNGTYTNTIVGIFNGSGKEAVFEVERGTYSYSNYDNTVTYTCLSDSLLDYSTQQMKGYSRKHVSKLGRELDTYNEVVRFTVLRAGRRQWITFDTYLASLANNTMQSRADTVKIDIAYALTADDK